MAQFGLHALIALYIVSVVPVFSPPISRSSFCYGLYIGNILPDFDIFVAIIVYAVERNITWEDQVHRTVLHSVITAVVLYFLAWLVELIIAKRQSKFVYDYGVVQSPNGSSGQRQKYDLLGGHKVRTANYKAFGAGLVCGILMHIIVDILYCFSTTDILFPLSLFGFTSPINIWENKTPSEGVELSMTVSELFSYAVFLLVLRVCIVKKLGKWTDVPYDATTVNMNMTDSDIEHGSMFYSAASFKDIMCPIDSGTLSKAKQGIKITTVFTGFQFFFFAVVTVLAAVKVIPYNYVVLIVFVDILVFCVPSFCYLSWIFRKILILKMEVE